MSKSRLNVSLDHDLAAFAKAFAAENRMTVADMVTQYLLSLKRSAEGKETTPLFADPAFRQAMEEAQAKLRDGSATWHTYDEVFGE